MGNRVVIHIATAGVGRLAVQIAKACGAYIILTTSQSKVDFVNSLGAEEVTDYTKDDFVAKAGQVDMVFEPLDGGHTKKIAECLAQVWCTRCPARSQSQGEVKRQGP